MTNYKKEQIANGIGIFGFGSMVVGFFVMCAEFAASVYPAIGFGLMIGGAVVGVLALTFIVLNGWL
jgi:hypothetical protein